MRVAVAVCSDRPPRHREACLAGLRCAGVTAPIVVGPGLVPPGMASARNAALERCSADVLAFVDDDVRVAPGWFEALRAAWAEAPDDRAAIGGPIAGGTVVPGSLDYGDRHLILDARERTLHGGNLSLRCSALRGAEGFWPARGRDGLRDWFGDEHHAQRALAQGGWTIAYLPELRAERIAEPTALAEVVRQRAATGARNQLLGAPIAPGTAVRRLGSALAGSLLTTDGRRRRERAGRAAQAAGALLAGRLAAADVQPVAGSTPFAPSVAAPTPRLRCRSRTPRLGSQVLLYHRIGAEGGPASGRAVSAENFSDQMAALGDRVVALDAVVAGDAPPDAVAITFDDGYADILEPLRDAGVEATVFVSTGHVEEGRPFWWDELDRLLHTARADAPLVVEFEGVRAWRRPEAARAPLNALLQTLPRGAGEGVLEQVRAWSGGPPGSDPRPLTVDELRELARFAAIGAHTRDHTNLRHVGPAAARNEIARSRDDLARWLGTAPAGFSYPFGVPGRDLDEETHELVRDAGFSFAVVNAPGPDASPFAIPRRWAPNTDGAQLVQLLASPPR